MFIIFFFDAYKVWKTRAKGIERKDDRDDETGL